MKLNNLVRRIGTFLLRHENQILGAVLFISCIFSLNNFTNRLPQAQLAISQGMVYLPTQLIMNSLVQVIYLTFAAAILILSLEPRRRYQTAIPNLVSLLASFLPYGLVLFPLTGPLWVPIKFPLTLMLLGGLCSLIALFWLRQSFSVTPQVRGLITTGPYSFVRHPMYLGSVATMAGIVLLKSSVLAVAMFLAWIGLQFWRSRLEEQLLLEEYPDYRDYLEETGAFFPRVHMNNKATRALVILTFGSIFWTLTLPSSLLKVQASDDQAVDIEKKQEQQGGTQTINSGNDGLPSEVELGSSQDSEQTMQVWTWCISQNPNVNDAIWVPDSISVHQSRPPKVGELSASNCIKKICDFLKQKASSGIPLTLGEQLAFSECLRLQIRYEPPFSSTF